MDDFQKEQLLVVWLTCVHLMAALGDMRPVKPVTLTGCCRIYSLCVNRQQLSYPAFTCKHAHFPFLLWFDKTLWLPFQTSGKYLHYCKSSVLCVNEKKTVFISLLQKYQASGGQGGYASLIQL